MTELLDTFKPGTFSYQPFKKPMRSISIIDSNNNSENGENVIQPNTGRPRPFYRRSSLTFLRENTEILHQNPKSLMVRNITYLATLIFHGYSILQELLRTHFIKTYGLRKMKSILEKTEALPPVIQRLLLTLPCSDFEEICSKI